MTNRANLACVLVASVAASCIVIDPTGGKVKDEPPKVYCISNRASGACSCSTEDPGLGDDTEYVSNCDALPSDTQCCHDINGDGETTSCDCYRALCAYDTDTDRCECTYFGHLIVGNVRDNEMIVSTCPTTTCCRSSDSCYCGSSCFGDTPVSSCTTASIPAKRACGGGTRWAASCAGLKWTK